MEVSLSFVEGTCPCASKPTTGTFEKVSLPSGEVYVQTWMQWELVVSDTREGLGHNVIIDSFTTKPTDRIIRNVKNKLGRN